MGEAVERPVVVLSADDTLAMVEIIGWLTQPADERQRCKAVATLNAWLVYRAGGIPTGASGNRLKPKRLADLLQSLDERLHRALYAGQQWSLSLVVAGEEVAPWPRDWGLVARHVAEKMAIGDGAHGDAPEDHRRRALEKLIRPFRPVFHLAAAVNGLASERGRRPATRETAEMWSPLVALTSSAPWIDHALRGAEDRLIHSSAQSRWTDDAHPFLHFVREGQFFRPAVQ